MDEIKCDICGSKEDLKKFENTDSDLCFSCSTMIPKGYDRTKNEEVIRLLREGIMYVNLRPVQNNSEFLDRQIVEYLYKLIKISGGIVGPVIGYIGWVNNAKRMNKK